MFVLAENTELSKLLTMNASNIGISCKWIVVKLYAPYQIVDEDHDDGRQASNLGIIHINREMDVDLIDVI